MTDIHQRMLPGGSPAIAYDVGGDDDTRPLVLLHGLSANSTSWTPVIERTSCSVTGACRARLRRS